MFTDKTRYTRFINSFKTNLSQASWFLLALPMLILICVIPISSVAEEINLNQSTQSPVDNDRIQLLTSYADNVLSNGQDRWSGKGTPLLADGINVETLEPVEWIYNDERFIIHNLASQQNLQRFLVGLSSITGDAKYHAAAKAAVEYHFEHLRSDCGLLRWGGHQFINLENLEPVGHFDANCHEFKNSFPFYSFMWDINPQATAEFIRAFWNAHILDWNRLDMNRHGRYGLSQETIWSHDFQQGEPFFEASGLTFINCGSDLIYAGGMLYVLGQEKGALTWSKRLAEQYVLARHPETGLGVYQYSKPARNNTPPETGPLTGTLTYSSYGDRAENQFGADFPEIGREGWALWGGTARGIYVENALVQLELAEKLGSNGDSLLQWTLDGLKSFSKHAYNPADNSFRPMWADGTDLTGYSFPRTGYYGVEGHLLTPIKANESFLFSYARAYRLSKDPEIWDMVRSIMKGLGFGMLGTTSADLPELSNNTDNSNPETIFALLELYKASEHHQYLNLADAIAENIVNRSYHLGYFLPSSSHINANFDAIEPLSLLALEAVKLNLPESVPIYSGGHGYIHGQYADMGRTYDSRAIWSQKRE